MKKFFVFLLAVLLILAVGSCVFKRHSDNTPTAVQTPTPTAEVTASPTNAPTPVLHDKIYIINASSIPFFAIYISENTESKLGENIIAGSPLESGTEIEFPFINTDEKDLNIIVEDENGNRYHTPIDLKNGVNIELYLNDNELSAIIQ